MFIHVSHTVTKTNI